MAAVDSIEYISKEVEKSLTENDVLQRYKKNLTLINPKYLLITKTQLADYKKALQNSKLSLKEQNIISNYLEANVHPDTGKKIHPLFTMGGYVWSGIPIVACLLYFHSPAWKTFLNAHQSMAHKPLYATYPILFFQWLNQTQNSLFNYANRNASKTNESSLLISYILATSSAMGIAIGLEKLCSTTSTKSLLMRTLSPAIPFLSVASANVVNLLSMRYPELKNGIKVFTHDGKYVGVSKKAAKKALFETGLTRVIIPIPILIIPPLITNFMQHRKIIKRYPRLMLPINVLTVSACFTLAFPFALSIFPQTSKIKTKSIDVANPPKDPWLYYNKGL